MLYEQHCINGTATALCHQCAIRQLVWLRSEVPDAANGRQVAVQSTCTAVHTAEFMIGSEISTSPKD